MQRERRRDDPGGRAIDRSKSRGLNPSLIRISGVYSAARYLFSPRDQIVIARVDGGVKIATNKVESRRGVGASNISRPLQIIMSYPLHLFDHGCTRSSIRAGMHAFALRIPLGGTDVARAFRARSPLSPRLGGKHVQFSALQRSGAILSLAENTSRASPNGFLANFSLLLLIMRERESQSSKRERILSDLIILKIGLA